MKNKDLMAAKMLSDLSAGIVSIGSTDLFLKEGAIFNSFFSTTLSAGASYDIGILTGDKAHYYVTSNIITTADAVTVSFYENSTLSGGSSLSSNNRNRINPSVAKSSFKSGVTVTSPGNLLFQSYIGGSTGVGQTRAGGSSSGMSNSILKPNTQYLFRLINGSSASNLIHINWDWCELLEGVMS